MSGQHAGYVTGFSILPGESYNARLEKATVIVKARDRQEASVNSALGCLSDVHRSPSSLRSTVAVHYTQVDVDVDAMASGEQDGCRLQKTL
jgi:hypothetical protein